MAIIKINPNTYIRNGKLINVKGFNRLIKGNKINLSKAKERVKQLRSELSNLQQLTKNDPNKLEYGRVLNKTSKLRSSQISKGYFYKHKGQMIPTVDLPKIKNENNTWLIHSHPGGSPLSINDVIYPKKKGGTIFAIDADKSIYRSTKLGTTEEINNAYEEAKNKIKNSGLSKEILEQRLFTNPNVDSSLIKQDISAVATHKILMHLNKLGLIKYRTKLTNATKKKLQQYKDIMDIQLKKNTKLINFNKFKFN